MNGVLHLISPPLCIYLRTSRSMASVIELSLSRANPLGEQTVNRDLLLDLAPDREELLVNNSIESIRDGLKIVPQSEGDDE